MPYPSLLAGLQTALADKPTMASARTDRLPSICRGFVTTGGINPLAKPSGRAASGDVGAVVTAGGVNGDRRTLLGVGTYLIDTPKDSALQLRQRFLSFQEQHRGLVKSQVS